MSAPDLHVLAGVAQGTVPDPPPPQAAADLAAAERDGLVRARRGRWEVTAKGRRALAAAAADMPPVAGDAEDFTEAVLALDPRPDGPR